MARASLAAALGLLFVVGCSGTAVVDGAGGGSVSSSSSGTATSTQPSCGDLQTCCEAFCDKLESLSCWPSGGCQCPLELTAACGKAAHTFFGCLLEQWPGSYQCINGLPLFACGYCEAEAAELNEQCEDNVTCTPP